MLFPQQCGLVQDVKPADNGSSNAMKSSQNVDQCRKASRQCIPSDGVVVDWELSTHIGIHSMRVAFGLMLPKKVTFFNVTDPYNMETTPEPEQPIDSALPTTTTMDGASDGAFNHPSFEKAPGLEALSTAATTNLEYMRQLSVPVQSSRGHQYSTVLGQQPRLYTESYWIRRPFEFAPSRSIIEIAFQNEQLHQRCGLYYWTMDGSIRSWVLFCTSCTYTGRIKPFAQIFTAAILCVYEFLDNNATAAWSRHLSGTKSLFDLAEREGMMPLHSPSPSTPGSLSFRTKPSIARRATFWNFARQDFLRCFYQ
ncbi:hypothetical protein EYC84_007321 [Monilinia fructicola]|uniref:Uncharacterized protein n=1 Tax=Monilinia fructicola TaxID=38448 RepID=A0A5M9JMM7_MONFR|nr:hypothetical protein EYC84_007321 [Monilinia fructicola]